MVVFATIEAAVEAIRQGGPVVVMDDESRENEGDIILAAKHATTKQASHQYYEYDNILRNVIQCASNGCST